MSTSKVSVIIPSYNCSGNLRRLLDSLHAVDYPAMEVLVVDNGSTDGTVEALRQAYPWVHLVDAGPVNIGQTGCYNLGMHMADPASAHLILIDSDVVVARDMVGELVTAAASSPEIGIVTPMVLYLSEPNWVHQAGATVDLDTGKVTVGWGPAEQFQHAREVQNSGTVLLVKRTVIDRIGGLDDWFMCFFDADFCLRAKRAGFKTWYAPRARCYHDQEIDPAVWRPRVLSRSYLLGRNRVLFMRRHARRFWLFLLLLPGYVVYYAFEAFRWRQPLQLVKMTHGFLVGLWHPLRPGLYCPLSRTDDGRAS